jgi:hypothetical protein
MKLEVHIHHHYHVPDDTLGQIQSQLDAIEKIGRSLLNKMGTALELLTTANATLDDIDARTTAEGEEVKALADAYEALKDEIGKDNPEVVSALEGLNARLRATGDRVTSIYTAPTTPEVPDEEPAPEPTEETSGETEDED